MCLSLGAGFVGSDEFHLWRSGALVVLNTFGAMLAACLALPGVVAYVQSAAAAASAGKKGAAARRGKGSKGGGGGRDEALHQAVLVAGLVRALAAFCAALSAGVQRRHLYAWALFAPRFAFEAAFLLLTDLALLLVAALA